MNRRASLQIATLLAIALVLTAMAPLHGEAARLSIGARTVQVVGFSTTSCTDAEAMALQMLRQHYIVISYTSDRRGEECEAIDDELLGTTYFVTVTARVYPKWPAVH